MTGTSTRLARYITLGTTWLLPQWSKGPRGDLAEVAEDIAAAGYRGVQIFDPSTLDPVRAAGLDAYALGRVDTAADVGPFVQRWEELGVSSLTTHLGTGFEDDRAAAELLESFLAAAESASIEVLLETHRATVTQDPGRTVRFLTDYPELRFTGDLSHWYTGCEMPYGGFDWKLEAIGPVLQRINMLHGRISDPGCVQAAVAEEDSEHVGHFRQMWRAVFDAFLADPGDRTQLVFAPELLPAVIHYARTIPTAHGRDEEFDRWQQASLLCDLADQLFAEAVAAADEQQ